MTTDTIREGSIILPKVGNDGENIETQRKAVFNSLVKHFGGATVVDGRGWWRAPSGKLMAERVSVVSAAYVPSPEADTILRDIAQTFARDAGQIMTYLRYASGTVELVPQQGDALPDSDGGTPTIWRDALRQIVAYPVNGNSEPDMMATAIDAMQRLASAALGQTDATYTVWVQQSSGEGTMHVSAHVGKTPQEAAEHAITDTLGDWGWQDDKSHRGAVRVVGIAKGDVELVEWNDQGE